MTESFIEYTTLLSGLKIIERKPNIDHRGSFVRLWSQVEFNAFGFSQPIEQINYSVTTKIGSIRGLHFQNPPGAEVKFVSCIKGEIFDVAVDLRRGSPTFLKWHGEILSDKNNKAALIPKGFAHGFQSLSPDSQLIYLHTAAYDSKLELGLLAEDPMININWPLKFENRSERDKNHFPIASDWKGIEI